MIYYHYISTIITEKVFDNYVLATKRFSNDPGILLEIPIDQLLTALEKFADAATVSFYLRNNNGSCTIVISAEGGRGCGQNLLCDVRTDDDVDVAHMIDPDGSDPDNDIEQDAPQISADAILRSKRKVVINST